jgi:hypothetical protein
MRLDFRFSERPLEDLWCEAVVAFVFQRRFMTMGMISGLDAKLGGLLGRIQAAGFWTGGLGEDVLVASQGMIKAEKVLLCGLGPVRECDAEGLIHQVERVGRVLKGIHVTDFAVHIPIMDGAEAEYPAHLEASVRSLAAPYTQGPGDVNGGQLKIVFPVERFFSGSLLPVADRLRAAYGADFDVSVVIEGEKREAVGG